MFGRDVQGLEIVPRVLHFRPVGHAEAQPAHNLLQFIDCLRDRVQPAQPGTNAGHRRIEPPAFGLPETLRPASRALAASYAASIDCLSFVEPLAGGGLVGLLDQSQALSERLSAGRSWRRGTRCARPPEQQRRAAASNAAVASRAKTSSSARNSAKAMRMEINKKTPRRHGGHGETAAETADAHEWTQMKNKCVLSQIL